MDAGWGAEFAAQAQGIGRTLTHEIIGFGGTLRTLSGILDNVALNPTLAAAAVAYALLGVSVGGIFDRLARGRAVRAAGFFAACGGYFVRMLRLGPVTTATHGPSSPICIRGSSRASTTDTLGDMTLERDGLLLRVGLYVVFALVLFVVSLIFDFAKVRLVLEDRRSVISALGASMRFLRRRPLRGFGLYLLNGLGFLMVLRLWSEAAPQAWQSITYAFIATQVYLLVRIWLRLVFIASEVVFFQGELAHAGYTARPPHVWPTRRPPRPFRTSPEPSAPRGIARGEWS